MSLRDRIAAMLSLRSDAWAGMRQSANVEDRQNEQPPDENAPRSFDYAFKSLSPMLHPGAAPMPEATSMSRDLGSDDLDREYTRRLKGPRS